MPIRLLRHEECVLLSRGHTHPERSRTVLSLSANSFGLQHLQLCRVLAEVTRLARVSTLSKSVVLLLNDTSMYGADGAIRTHATYKVERISNPPQYHTMLTSAYCDVGAQEGIRTLTVSLPRDFHTTLCHHSRHYNRCSLDSVFTMPINIGLGGWCIASTHNHFFLLFLPRYESVNA